MSNGARNSLQMNITCFAKAARNQHSRVSTPILRMRASTSAVAVALSSFDLLKSFTRAVDGHPSGSQQIQRVFDSLMTSPVVVTASKCVVRRAMAIWATFSMGRISEIRLINVGASIQFRCVLRPAPCTNNRYSSYRKSDSEVLNIHQSLFMYAGSQNHRHDGIERAEHHHD